MDADSIRETYLSYFEERGHRRMASASLVPATHDPSVLLTTAGMQPFKPYFMGMEDPPQSRLCSSQKCFRATDIEEVGNTARHLTFFEMLGNFSFGDYFKEEATSFGWGLSTGPLGLDPDLIWVSVFGGDEELGLGPDDEAIELWKRLGVPEERIVPLGRADNFWQAGPTGPCGPCSEMHLDRGERFEGELPGDSGDRFVEYWNHVFMTYELHPDGSLTPLPKRNIDTGLGLERVAAAKQGVDSVFETDGFRPLVDLAEELSGRSYSEDLKTTRAMRILADHSRAMTFLTADGVVPSNEDRGYILRRVMRRAVQQGRVLGLEAPYLERFAELVIEMRGDAFPELRAERETILRWVRAEEEGFGRTLEHGSELLGELISQAKSSGAKAIPAEDAFRLHDTFGFPFEMTQELLAEEGLEADAAGFARLMTEQRERARASAGFSGPGSGLERVQAFAAAAPPTRFVGYERLQAQTSVSAAEGEDGRMLMKLEESPFYAEGGGQVSDRGVIRWDEGEGRVLDVFRLGDDQAVALDGEVAPEAGQVVDAEVDRDSRVATMRNHTATHLLHAALRQVLGTHVRQAGSAVRPDKLRFDFTHHGPLDPGELREVEDRINDWVKRSLAVGAMEMALDEARRLGAMALFGEKYGDWVRVVEIEDVSRELCGGTHTATTGEVGIFTITTETSSASNVRRIEALTGPAAIDWFRGRAELLERVGQVLRSPDDPLAAAEQASRRLAEIERDQRKAGAEEAASLASRLAEGAEEVSGVKVVVGEGPTSRQPELLAIADRVRQVLGDAVVVLGGASDDKVGLVASVADSVISRGVSAAAVVSEAAGVVGGGGGGRDNVAQAGGKDPERLEEALAVARRAVESALS